jgi:hypothetical protein
MPDAANWPSAGVFVMRIGRCWKLVMIAGLALLGAATTVTGVG